ncbi:MAG: hypothetical protein CL840_06505 [Crocinitomicaceae bacterium]|nr:hypothetical protein [Crocinitomicaceae bacterium]|tara:strand:- start:5181 stop:5864 length:684 start_codon:yes stop_codon:yes gene_type:complete
MNNKNLSWKLIAIGCLALSISLIPLTAYIFYFKENLISNNPNEWALFGDFIGGTTNTLVSIFSLIILAYITVLIAKNGNQEQHQRFLLEKKIIAFDELGAFLLKLNVALRMISLELKNTTDKASNLDLEGINLGKSKIREQVEIYVSYGAFIFTFYARYGHLFDFDFESDIYKDLVSTSNKLRGELTNLYENINLTGRQEPNNLEKVFSEHLDCLVVFINALKEELE